MGALAIFLDLCRLVPRAADGHLCRRVPKIQKGNIIVVVVGWAKVAPVPIALNLLLGC